MDFELDERLQRDTLAIGDWPLSRVLLMNDAQYPWLILVPRRSGLREIYDLPAEEAALLMRESCVLAKSMAALFSAQKMNVANLGNIVAQLHLHHVARFPSDPAWPGPIWGKLPAQAYPPAMACALIERLQGSLDLTDLPLQRA